MNKYSADNSSHWNLILPENYYRQYVVAPSSLEGTYTEDTSQSYYTTSAEDTIHIYRLKEMILKDIIETLINIPPIKIPIWAHEPVSYTHLTLPTKA